MIDNEDILGNEAAEAQVEAVAGLTMPQLRKAASLLGIKPERHWRSEDFVEAIQDHQRQASLATAVFDTNIGPKPGYARVVIHRDPTPNHANSPVHLMLNGRIIAVPRGGEYDIPIPFVNVLKDAVTTVKQEAGTASGNSNVSMFVDENKTSYPFQVVSITPGRFTNPIDQRSAKYARRKAFFDMYGAWPTDAELKEFEKAKMQNDFRNS